MAEVRYGPTRVRYSGDEARGRQYLPRALQLLRVTQERQRAGGLNVLGSQARLDDDSYCYVVLAGGMANLHIVAGYPGEEPVRQVELLGQYEAPDFLSGVVSDGYIVDVPAEGDRPAYRTMTTFRPTQACIEAYRPGDDKKHPQVLAEAFQPMKRLAVEPADQFGDLRNTSPSGIPVFSQYVKLKPTMYSGMMRRVVQALMGFGRQRVEKGKQVSLYSDDEKQKKPDGWPAASAKYETEVANNGLQVRYDWKFSRTHGIATGSDGTHWLVEIGVNGVIAMPLPLHPYTQTPEFRDKVQSMGDIDAADFIETFGGFPTGEAFPSGIDAWVRAGRVLRLLSAEDMEPFYRNAPYSSVMGWAFNLRGDEAHNTAYYFGDDLFQRGVHYAIYFQIGALDDEQTDAGKSIARKIATLRGDPNFNGDVEPVLWKCRRLTRSQVMVINARARTARELFDAVDELELEPIATASAVLKLQSEGYLYHPGKTGNLIKFPEPAIGLLVSHDMNPMEGASGERRCDTVVHVFFVENELKWVKYFRDMRQGADKITENNYEPCMYVGSWAQHEETGGQQMFPALYSNDFDDRFETSPSVTDTTIVGLDRGYSQVAVNDCLPWPIHSEFMRFKRFRMTTTTNRESNRSMQTGVAVPFYDREAYYYAVHHRNSGRFYSLFDSDQTLRDPWTYWTWRYFGGWNTPKTEHPDGCGIGMPYRTVMNPIHVQRTYCMDFDPQRDIEGDAVYRPSGCSDFADEGPWSSLCVNADAQVYFVAAEPKREIVETEEATGHWDVWLVSSSGLGNLKTAEADSIYFGLWPLISPSNGDGNVSADQYIAETHNAFGEAQSMRYQINLNAESKIKGHPDWSEMLEGPLTYIGVVNG